MPAERNSHNHGQSSRRASGDDAAAKQREQELRRARGEIACVECQRLKLRCDRKVPCASCIRRNRAAMCPNGHAWSDQETRTLLSDTAQLHRKLSEMSQRIRQLEDALEISHSVTSSSPHPLLRDELLSIKRGVGPSKPPEPEQNDNDDTDDYVEAMGTLSISDHGVSRFIGRSGGSESLFLLGHIQSVTSGIVPPDGRQIAKQSSSATFPYMLSRGSDAWLLMPPYSPASDLLNKLWGEMPTFERASGLCETYLENFAWILRVVRRDQLFSDLLPVAYGRKRAEIVFDPSRAGWGKHRKAEEDINENGEPFGGMHPHELALFLMVLAAGALADLTLPPYNDEAEKYYQMALCVLSVSQVVGTPTLAVVQAVALMGAYNAHCGRNTTLDLAGSLFNLAANMGISMGLHKDTAKWKVQPRLAERRRNIFWELFTCDGWHNLANGKPPSFVLHYTDCKYPEEESKVYGKDGKPEPSYWRHRHEVAQIVYAVQDTCSSTKTVKYAQIMEFDRKITDLGIPSHLRTPLEGSSIETDGPMTIMQRIVPLVCRDALLMYIHRGFFAKALIDHPEDPCMSQYAHSYLSAYRAALSILKIEREYYTAFPNLMGRFWSFWTHAFSATVIIGSIVVKSKSADTARAALIELNLAVGLFEKASQHSERAKRSLPTLLRLRDRAYAAAKSFGDIEPAISSIKQEEYEEELLLFSGKGKKLINKDDLHRKLLELKRRRDASASLAMMSMQTSSTPQVNGQTQPFPLGPAVPSPSSDQASNSPSTLQLPSTPDMLAMGTGLPASWAAWTDQEALLINYLSSGIDLNVAEMAAYAGVPDPSAFLWPGMSSSNSPESQQQSDSVPENEVSSSSASSSKNNHNNNDPALLSPTSAINFLLANGIEPSPFAPGAPANDPASASHVPVAPQLDSMQAATWDPRQWQGQQAFY